MALGVCDRCDRKLPHKELRPDGMYPNLMVCRMCWDRKHPGQTPIKFPKNELAPVKNARPLKPLGTYVGPTIVWENDFTLWEYDNAGDMTADSNWEDD